MDRRNHNRGQDGNRLIVPSKRIKDAYRFAWGDLPPQDRPPLKDWVRDLASGELPNPDWLVVDGRFLAQVWLENKGCRP